MKGITLILGLLILTFGCKKDKLDNTIVGTWELRESSGGWTAIKQYAPGNGNLVIFSEQDQLTKKVVSADTLYNLLYKYTLIKEDDCGENMVLQPKDNNDEYKQRATISHDTLYISDGCIADGSSFTYVRK